MHGQPCHPQVVAWHNNNDCRSAGKKQEFEGVEYTIEELGENR
jgi:hypothetical protein